MVESVIIISEGTNLTPMPRIQSNEKFRAMEYDNSFDAANYWWSTLQLYYPEWFSYHKYKASRKDIYLIHPTTWNYNGRYYFEPLIKHPKWYGYLVEANKTKELVVLNDIYFKLAALSMETKTRTFEYNEIKEILLEKDEVPF